jgi:hypothetical protein
MSTAAVASQLEDARNETEGLRQEHLALVKQMERQLRTLCEIEALLPSHQASASLQVGAGHAGSSCRGQHTRAPSHPSRHGMAIMAVAA